LRRRQALLNPRQLVFIDESGCAGFKFMRGSMENFVVAMVMFRDRADARRTTDLIRQAQIDLKIYPEFKFSDSRDEVRDEFFQRVRDQRFEIRAIVAHKPSIYSTHLRENKERFYNYFVKTLVKYNADSMSAADVRIDLGRSQVLALTWWHSSRPAIDSDPALAVLRDRLGIAPEEP